MLDFNEAPAQPSKIDMTDLRSRIQANGMAILHYLLPQGKVEGNHYVAADISGGEGKSLRVSLKNNFTWKDFADPEGKKGDLISLWRAVRKCSFEQAVSDLDSFISEGKIHQQQPSKQSQKKEKKYQDLGAPSETYWYYDEQGKVIATVAKYLMPDGSKEFRPYDVTTKAHTHPALRPLYNIPQIMESHRVVLVEGEKCANSLMSIGIIATTAMGGANAPIDKTNWSYLAGKSVLIWPDNDDPGKAYAERAKAKLNAIGCRVAVLDVPEGKRKKWDCADAVEEGFDVQSFLDPAWANLDTMTSCLPKGRVILTDWGVEAYQGNAPERNWLVRNVFPMAAPSILAASGGSGKGMLGIDLALQVVCDYEADVLEPFPKAFGGEVVQQGSVVILSAEDDQAELHRRFEVISQGRTFDPSKRKLLMVPLSSCGGPMPLIVPGKNGPEITKAYQDLREQLFRIPDLKLLIFDPLASFALVEFHKDPGAAQFVNGVFASLASETGAAILIVHHLNKVRADKQIKTPEQALEMITGTAMVVNGVRCAYALWPMDKDDARRICGKLSLDFERGRVFCGAVVKSNGPHDTSVRTFVRQPNGLLVVMDDVLANLRATGRETLDVIVDVVRRAAEAGRPFTKKGAMGLYERREELPPDLKAIGRNRLEELAQQLLDGKEIVKCAAKGSKNVKWLDVIGGPFTIQGGGTFEQGFVDISETY